MKISLEDIEEATDHYVTELQQYDIKLIVEAIAESYQVHDQVHVFEYPLPLKFTQHTSPEDILNHYDHLVNSKGEVTGLQKTIREIYKPNLQKRFNIGIASFDMAAGIDHYMAFVLDNSKKRIYVWDSIESDMNKVTEFTHMLSVLYPTYDLKGAMSCKHCYQPGGGAGQRGSYTAQNIFCHTWSLWFVDQVIEVISQGHSLDVLMDTLKSQCKTPKENLILIKRFAKYIGDTFFGTDDQPYVFDPNFQYIWSNPQKKVFKIF